MKTNLSLITGILGGNSLLKEPVMPSIAEPLRISTVGEPYSEPVEWVPLKTEPFTYSDSSDRYQFRQEKCNPMPRQTGNGKANPQKRTARKLKRKNTKRNRKP